MSARLLRYLVLPAEITPFERSYLGRMNRVALWFFAAHVPVFVAVALLNGTSALRAAGLSLLMVAGPWLASRLVTNPRHLSITFGFTAMCLGGVLVDIGQGPMQIEMHFYFFTLIALLAVFGNPLVVLVAAVTVALHHLILWLVLPASVFNYDASIWAVAVHALFVVIESVAACFVARSFFDDVIGLERVVQARTAEVDARNRELRLIFDTVGQGFVTIGLDGRMSSERSAILGRWLGTPAPEDTLATWLGRADAHAGEQFELGWQAVVEDVLPLDLCLDQMPRVTSIGARQLSITYTAILDGERLVRVLVVFTDVTAEVERERVEADQRDLLSALDRILRDRAAFRDFLVEVDRLLADLSAGALPPTDARRHVHTIKGNAALFGLGRVAGAAHALEDRMDETGAAPDVADLSAITSVWASLKMHLSSILGERGEGVTLSQSEYDDILQTALSLAPHEILVQAIQRWRLEPMQGRLFHLAEHARAIASRLGKPGLDVRVEPGDLRVDPAVWAPFWGAAVHLVRNAVDHGIESTEERAAVGKAATGTVWLAARQDGESLVVEVRDDGRGVVWEDVASRARALDLPATTPEDLRNALIHDRLSTRGAVGEFSGRGVGLGAVVQACAELGGCLQIDSVRGQGTVMRCVFPIARAALAAA